MSSKQIGAQFFHHFYRDLGQLSRFLFFQVLKLDDFKNHHPGGFVVINGMVGKDGTLEMFNHHIYHPQIAPYIKSLWIGNLEHSIQTNAEKDLLELQLQYSQSGNYTLYDVIIDAVEITLPFFGFLFGWIYEVWESNIIFFTWILVMCVLCMLFFFVFS